MISFFQTLPDLGADEPRFPLLSIARLRMGIDGNGITTLVAGVGCPLNCRWCINKRLLREAPAKEVTAAQLLAQVRIDDLYFQVSGGGITFGGGESLLHAMFIRRFRERCPGEWRISAETSLSVPFKSILTVIDSVDEFIVDCKDMDPQTYFSYTGGDCSLMKENLQMLLEAVGPERVIVRVPLIPGYNIKEDQAENASELRAMGIKRLDLFDYVIREQTTQPA